MASDSRFAVLIDAENVSVKYIKIIFNELSKDGIATYKRIYGDSVSYTQLDVYKRQVPISTNIPFCSA